MFRLNAGSSSVFLDDHADEPFDCVNGTCPLGYYKCPFSGKCLPLERVCDNVEDCSSIDRIGGIMADETSQACSTNQFIFLSMNFFFVRFCVNSTDEYLWKDPIIMRISRFISM